MKPLVVSAAYGPKYTALIPRLVRSAHAAGLECVIESSEKAPASGLEAWKQKPRLVLENLARHGGPVLWVDVDFIFRDRPSFDFAAAADCALYASKPGTFEDGVMLWNPTRPAELTLRRWYLLCHEAPIEWTNLALSRAVAEERPDVEQLPPVYHWVERWMMTARFGRRVPLIEEVPCVSLSRC